jgi:hypothetical protein
LEALVPILVRPVREQLEHDRIIRLLEAKWRRKFKVDANPGDERNAGVKVPAGTIYPDLVLTEEGGRKPKALIEVETNESVNHLEAMAQWANLAKSRTSLILFEAARRLSNENSIKLTELWTYHVLGDQVRFTSVFREHGAEPADLIEKAEVFTTERAAPAPRPIPVEPEPVLPPAAEPDRPRKLAVKAGSRPAAADGVVAKVAGAVAKVATKVAPKAGAKVAAPEPPPPAAPAKASAAKPPAPKPEAPAKPVAPAAPVKVAAPVRAPAPKPVEKPDKKVAEKAAGKPSVKLVAKVAARPAAKPAEKAIAKPAEKVAKKAPAKPEVKKAVKAAPAKPVVAAKKGAPKVAARPLARKAAAPVRAPARPSSARKAPAPAAKSRPSKRK